MSKTAKRLGRGLDTLVSNLRGLTESQPPETKPEPKTPPPEVARDGVSGIQKPAPDALARPVPVAAKPATETGMIMIAADLLQPNPYQPRVNMDDKALASLVSSIRRSGILQPITVRKRDGRHEIIAGERRWTAAKICGHKTVPVIFRDADDEQMFELALIENIQREDLNPIDRAKAYKRFCARFNLKADDLADRMGEDRSTVANYLRILDLSPNLQDMVAQGKLSMGHGRCLLGITDPRRRESLAGQCIEQDWSVRNLEQAVRASKTDSSVTTDVRPAPPKVSPHLRDLQHRFEQAIKTKVTIQEGRRKGSGKIVIEYYSLDDFDRIASSLGVNTDRD